jgi:Uma2 family endonuclease
MANLALETTQTVEGRVVRFSERPITFEEFLDLSGDSEMELVDGVMVEQMAAQLDHEKLFGWLFSILKDYVRHKGLGIVLGSRTAVEISSFGGRLPDILFVRQEHMDIVRQKAVYGAPDLIIEIVSPNDRPSDIIALETDYRSIDVPEIWFIDQPKRRIRVLHKRPEGYTEEQLTTGTLRSEAVQGLELNVEWLFTDPRPDEFDTLTKLLA